MQEFLNADASRSGLDRCLRRHGVNRLDARRPATERAPVKTFKDYEPGFVHVDIKYLPQMPGESRRRYLFVAIDRATRWVYTETRGDKTQRSACAFLKALHAKTPFRMTRLLTDNDTAFTDRFSQLGKRPSGQHDFDKACAAYAIEHRLAPPRHPQTNGMVERFNGRISEVLATTRFRSRDDLQTTLRRYEVIYNQHIPQKAIQHMTPIAALRDWQQRRPGLFVRSVRNHPEIDT